MTVTEVEAPFKVFEVRPQLLESGKISNRLVRSDLISCGVQVVASGGETNLHAHKAEDAIWLVLNGQATFYTTDDRIVASVGKYEGVLVPRGAPYWFESSSDENLVIMRIGARAQTEEPGRVDYTPRAFATGDEAGPRHEAKPLDGKRFGD